MVFIVIAVSAWRGLIWPASMGALAACAVGVMLSSFGVFWTGEGLGIEWPGADLVLIGFAALFLIVGLVTARQLRSQFIILQKS